jgi:hypothetical protein
MTAEHQDRLVWICLLVSSALTIGGLLNWWRTDHLPAALVFTGIVPIATGLLYLRSRLRSRARSPRTIPTPDRKD